MTQHPSESRAQTQPQPQTSESTSDLGVRRAVFLGVTGFAFGAVTGAAVMYLFDPDRGRRRRALAKDQVARATSEAASSLRATTADVRNRSKGWLHETGRKVRSSEPVDDTTLKARVRSALGHESEHPHSIVVSCDGGKVTLAGPVLESEAEGLLAAAKSVPGARSVRDLLQRHETAEGVPALQARADSPSDDSKESEPVAH